MLVTVNSIRVTIVTTNYELLNHFQSISTNDDVDNNCGYYNIIKFSAYSNNRIHDKHTISDDELLFNEIDVINNNSYGIGFSVKSTFQSRKTKIICNKGAAVEAYDTDIY